MRALARDLGCSLGFPAHLSQLRRLSSGRFELADAYAWPASADAALVSTAEAARRALPAAILAETGERRAFASGKRSSRLISLASAGLLLTETEAWFNGAGQPIALGHERTPGEFRVVRGMRTPSASNT